EAELAKSRDDAEYVTYSPREKLDSEYNERWFKYSEESKYGNEITDMKYIKVFLIDGVYYQEEIFNLSDVLFKS
ncbi:MAG: hypothetical protein IJW73_03215, partial [Candidatus Gastranaerophilales bacterium]|nr:hypothetical protein [Candidatus Gastranaerophilales bacterium]